MAEAGPSEPTPRAAAVGMQTVTQSLMLDEQVQQMLRDPNAVKELWKSVKPPNKYALLDATASGAALSFDPRASLRPYNNANAPGRQSLALSEDANLDHVGESFVALLAERESIYGPSDQMPYTFFVSPVAARKLAVVMPDQPAPEGESTERDALQQTVMEYLYSMTTGGPDDETLVDVNFYDRFVFVQALDAEHYVATLYVVSTFDERAPRVHVFHTLPSSDAGALDSAVAQRLVRLVLDQLTFLRSLAGLGASYQAESPQTTSASGVRAALEHLYVSIKIQRQPDEQSEVLIFERLDVLDDAAEANAVLAPGPAKRGASSPRESLTYALLAAQFVSATEYHDDNRFLRRAAFRRYPSSAWQTELALSLLEAYPRESPLAFAVVRLPGSADELLSDSMWHRSRIMHPVDQWALSEFFFREANKQIRLSLQPDDELNLAWLEYLHRIDPCGRADPPTRPVPGELIDLTEDAMREASVGERLQRPATTASTVPERRNKHKLDVTELQVYYQPMGAFFASPWRATSDGVEPSKKSKPGPGTSSYVANGWSAGFPLFRRLPLREDLFSYDAVKLMKLSAVEDWVAQAKLLRKTVSSDRPEYEVRLCVCTRT